MENKYQLTQEEINKILRRSPYSLGSSPAESGLGAEQIKRYFYDFIYYMAENLNLHLKDVGTDLVALEEGSRALQREVEELLTNELRAHVTNSDAHPDIREAADGASALAQAAYNLASGKSKVYINTSFGFAVMELQNESLKHGDFIMVIDKGCPDFVVVDRCNFGDAAIEIDPVDLANGNLPSPQVGGRYRLNGIDLELLAIESGIDTGSFLKKSDLAGFIDKNDNADKIPTAGVVSEALDALEAKTEKQIENTQDEIDRVEGIAKGANQAICFDDYTQMVEHFRNAPAHKYNNGQNIMIVDLDVPDLWVSLAFNESDYYSFYDYQIEDIAKDVIEYGFIYIGHYRLSALETQKVDLAEYVTTEELAVEATACNAYAEGLVRNLDNYVEENFAKKEDISGTSGYEDVTIDDITLEEDTLSIEITSTTFADINKVTDLIITFEVAKPAEGNTADNPLYVRFNGSLAAVIGKTANGWANTGYIMQGKLFSTQVKDVRICLAQHTLAANGTSGYTMQTTLNPLSSVINSIQIIPYYNTDNKEDTVYLIPKGTKVKIVGRVVK